MVVTKRSTRQLHAREDTHLGANVIDLAITDLHTAAKSIGLNEIEIKATIGSGFKRGGENPKILENSDTVPYTSSEFDRLVGRLAQKEMLVRDEETRQDKIKKAREVWERAVPISRETKTQSDRRYYI